jgi:DNA gyrase subunit B
MTSNYTADDIQALEGLDAVRKRPGMYIGSTDSRGLTHLVWEIFDNSVDEALAGHCDRIDVTLHSDGSVEIADNGRGIPVDINTKTGMTGLELCLTTLHAGGKFGGKAFSVSGGLHGVGASVTNALSSRMDAVVYRDKKRHTMSFQRGVVGAFATAAGDAKFTKKAGVVSTKDVSVVSGTTIRFWPDASIFIPGSTISPDDVASRLQRTAFLVPGLVCALYVGDTVTEFCYTGGLSDMVEHIATGAPIGKTPVVITGSGEFEENIPVLTEDGDMRMETVIRHVDVEIALLPTVGYDNETRSFVNVISTPGGGTHNTGFNAGVLKWVKDTANLKAKDEPPKIEDALEGLYAVVSVKLPEPQFEGQTKEILGTKPVQNIVRDVVVAGLVAWAAGRGNSATAKTWLEKTVTAARIRVQSRENRDTQRRKTALEGGNSLPAKLVDCRSRDNSELIIVEGDSALGTAKAGRFASHQALLPIRGKIINAQKATIKSVLDNTECAAIIQCLGAGFGKTFDVEQMRYERVVLMADADVDGSHIRTLLIALFWGFMRPLVEEGRLYSAVPPLHHVKTRGRNPQEFFTYTSSEMEEKVAELDAAGESVVRPVQRFKGLGEMNADELRLTTLHPETRTLRRITVGDATEAAAMLELLMGSAVEPRRDYIIGNVREVEL